MKRRSFLATVGAGILAGCATTETDPTESEMPMSAEPSDTTSIERATATPTESTTPTTVLTTPGLSIDQSVLEAPSVTSQQPIPWVRADVHNSSSSALSLVQLQHRFYDSNDELLDTRISNTQFIPANTTWRDYVRFYMEKPDELDHVESQITEQSVVSAPEINEYSIDNSNLDTSDEGTTNVVGEIEVSADFDRIVMIAPVYSSDHFRGALYDTKTDVSAGDLLAFSSGSLFMRTPPDNPELPSRHEFRLFDGLL